MAKVVLEPIGDPRETCLPEETWTAQKEAMASLTGALAARREDVRAGWGPKYIARVRDKGKLPTWERIDALRDAGATIAEGPSLIGHAMREALRHL